MTVTVDLSDLFLTFQVRDHQNFILNVLPMMREAQAMLILKEE